MILAMLAMTCLGARAGARGPVMLLTTNATIAQGTTTNLTLITSDDAVGWSSVVSYTAAFVSTNLLSTNTVLTVVGVSNNVVPGNYANVYFETNLLEINPSTLAYGTNIIVVIATDLWGDASTNRVALNVTHVSQPPNFTFQTNRLVVNEDSGLQTNLNFLSWVTNGAGNPPGLTWKFAASIIKTATNNVTNSVTFNVQPTIAYDGTNGNGLGASLVFSPTNHSFGSNLVTVVMTDSGTAINGGKIACTNSFWLVVAEVAHAPVISWNATNVTTTVLENTAGTTNLLINVTGDVLGSVLTLSATSSNSAVGVISVTNVAGGFDSTTNFLGGSSSAVTNCQFRLWFDPTPNAYGTATNWLVAGQTVGNATLWSTNKIVVTVTHVSQPPSFMFSTNTVLVSEEVPAQTVTNFLTSINSGAGNPVGTNWTFTATAATTNLFTVQPTIAHNGNLAFTPKPHTYGTNTVTVVMLNTDTTSTTNNGGIKTFTNSFTLAIACIPHVPAIAVVASQSVKENGSGTNITVTLSDYDSISNNLALTVYSVPISTNASSVATATVTATNGINNTNTQFVVHLAGITNMFGTNQIRLVASELAGTNATSTNIFNLVVTHVTQPPSFVLSTNSVLTPEQFTSTPVTNASFLTSITNGPGNLPGTNWTFALTAANKALFATQPAIAHNGNLTFTPAAKTNGTTTVTVVMTDGDTGESTTGGGVTTFTNSFSLTISYMSLTPSFAFATNTLVVPEESGPQTNLNFISAINTGLGKPASVTWTFAATTSTNNPVNTNDPIKLNAQFDAWPQFGTNGTLTFASTAHSFGSNLVTVVMSDTGTNGSCTNTFLLVIAQIPHTPQITWATNQTILENGGVMSAVINVWDYDAVSNNLALTAVSSNASVASVSVTATNVISATNTQFTLTYTPVANMFGSSVIELSASELVGTNLPGTTNFLLTVGQVSQPPSFAFATNILVEPEHAGAITVSNFLTSINTGAGNEPGLTWMFTVTPQSAPGNVSFAPLESPSVTTNGTLTFGAQDYSYGTNVVTVVMTDSGGVNNGGVISFTTNFMIEVPWVNYPPSFNLGVSTTTADKYNVPVTLSNVAVNILPGPLGSSQTNETVVFHVSSVNNSSLLTAQPVLDSNGTLTFTPGDQAGTVTVHIYAQNSGGTANGGVDSSTNQTFTIIIPPNTFQGAAGSYVGLFYGTNTVALAGSGQVSLNLTANGSFTGSLLCGNDNNSFSGQFDISNYSATVSAGNYALNLAVNTASQAISGAVTNSLATWNSTLQGYHSGYGSALDTNYLAVLPGLNVPPTTVGDSVFRIGVSSGVATVAGNLADLTTVSLSSPLCTNGFVPVYQPLYVNGSGANGLLIGWINLNNAANDSSTPGSTLIWFSDTNATALYASGFTNQAAPQISTFDVLQSQLLPVNKGYVELTGGGLAIPVVAAVSIDINNNIIVDPVTGSGLSLTVNTGTGEVQGTYVDGNGTTNNIESAILQNENIARGYFQGTNNESGSFILVANATLPYSPGYPAFTAVTPWGAMTATGVTTSGIANLVIPENSATNSLKVSFSLYDPLTNGFTVSCFSANSNVVSAYLNGSGAQRELWFTPVTNNYGSNVLITVTADDGNLHQTNIFTINTTIGFVNQAPSFALSNNAYTVDQYGVQVTLPTAITNIQTGPSTVLPTALLTTNSQSWETVSFTVTNNATNLFLVQPAVSPGGQLTYTPSNVVGTVIVGVQAVNSGGTANSGVNASASQLITITIPANPFTTLVSGAGKGVFSGLFYDNVSPSPALDSSGLFSLVLTNDGSFTGYLVCGGNTNTFTGRFSLSTLQASVTTGNYTLALTLDTTADTISGTVNNTVAGWGAPVALQSYLAAAPSLAGTYLVALPGLANPASGPAGNSTLTATVNASGVATIAGHMADNYAVAQVSQLSADGHCPIYIPLYTNDVDAGLLMGWLVFTNNTGVMTDSSLTWFNVVGTTPLYSAGFTNTATPVASLYANSPLNDVTGVSHYAVLSGGVFGATSITNAVTVINDGLTVDTSATNQLVLTLNETTGQLQGSFVDGSGVTNHITSVILQTTNTAFGYFTSADGDGSFTLLNNYPMTPYPIVFTGITNVTMLENGNTVVMPFQIFDALTTNITSVVCTPSDPNVTVSVNANLNQISITPVAYYSTNSVSFTVTATDGNTTTSITNFNLTVTWVNQVPTFSLAAGVASGVLVNQYDSAVTIAGAVTSISPGAGASAQETSQTVSFTVTNNNNSLFLVQPAVDASGQLTFKPGSVGGTVIVGVQAVDNGGTANGGTNTSPSQTFTITIPNNVFQNVTGPNPTATFAGLFYDATNGVVPSSSGYFALVLTNDGTFNVNLVNAGATNSVSGEFSIANSNALVAVSTYSLTLTIDPGAGTVNGFVTNTAVPWIAELSSYLMGATSISNGTYMVALPGFDDNTAGPPGYSVFNVGVNTNGAATVAGSMADGAAASQATALSAAGYCPIYIPLYANHGLLLGWLNFTNDPVNESLTADSSLAWYSAANASNPTGVYTNGFTNQIVPLASPYFTNAPYANNLLGSSSSHGYAYVLLSGADLGDNPVVTKVGITNNIITVPAKNHSLSLNINTNTGMVQGWYLDGLGYSNNIEGAIIQNGASSAGYFNGVTTNQAGLFELFGN